MDFADINPPSIVLQLAPIGFSERRRFVSELSVFELK